jgi:hydrogenase maturation protease
MRLSLKQILDEHDRNILFAGVGNVLKKDDGVGVYVARRIKPGSRVGSLAVEMGIENYIGKINSLAPDILIIIDACDFGKDPGFLSLAKASEFMEVTTNTHNISLRKLSELFFMPVYILGIQPADIGFGEGMCNEVTEAANRIVELINRANIKKVLSRNSFKIEEL